MSPSPALSEPPEVPTRDRILDAAETVFAQEGFAGAGMKAIATGAGVAQGLLHYHFKSKDALYAAVVARRSARINTGRRAALAQVDLSAPDALEQVFAALLAPPLGPEGGGAAYARIFAGLVVGDARDQALVREHYDPVAADFIDALCMAEPRASRAMASWAYSFAIGALIGVVARNGRPERLGGSEGLEETGQVTRRLVAFCTAGLGGMVLDNDRI